jgi:Na+/phosphate symporter
VERIGDCVEAVIRTVHTKVAEGTLFSDKAVAELSSIYNAVRDMARDVKDIVLTANPVLMEHTVAMSEKTSQAARDFATHHEERLITGVCQPKHSSLYLDMVDNLRMVSGHLKEMVEKLRD